MASSKKTVAQVKKGGKPDELFDEGRREKGEIETYPWAKNRGTRTTEKSELDLPKKGMHPVRGSGI